MAMLGAEPRASHILSSYTPILIMYVIMFTVDNMLKNNGRLVCAVNIASRHENVKMGSWQLLSMMKAREKCEQTAVFCI